MQKIKQILPGLGVSLTAGAMTGILIFIFKWASASAMELAAAAYDKLPLPLLILGAAVLGTLSVLLLKRARDCRGGGIPAAAVSVRGLVPMRWRQSMFGTFLASLISFLGGVPLGNEGPSVQMGAAAGKAAAALFGKNGEKWEKHTMGGAAGAGFAVATGAPLAGLVFVLEEMHKKVSAAFLLTGAAAVGAAVLMQKLLLAVIPVHGHTFGFAPTPMLPLGMLWMPLLVGVACALVSVLFTLLYHGLHQCKLLRKIPFGVKIVGVFICTAILGYFWRDVIGSGSTLIEKVLRGEGTVALLLTALFLRGVIMMFANHEGVCGGMFIPTLALGAVVAALLARWLPVDGAQYGTLIAVGMTAFLAASNRTPLTALLYAVEALCGVGNLPALALGIAAGYLCARLTRVEDCAELAAESRVKTANFV